MVLRLPGKSSLSVWLSFVALFLHFVLSAGPTLASQEKSFEAATPAEISFSYRFENPRFHISVMEVDLEPDGTGVVRFKRGESDDLIDFKMKLLPTTLDRIRQLIEQTRFLTSDEDYQSKKDFSHLGWMTLLARQGERERKVRFNYTHNLEVRELADIFRAIASQGIHLFDIETSQQYQPLDLPGQLDSLEADLKLERVAEPEQVVEALRDIAANDALPLIARNKAQRMIAAIEKKKFKSPVKTTN
ncbi:MAG TPA: hypothetical protein VJQ56_10855 [Blastocatellia bacterium]|nr:hypothetical protein [Blastocatellia bacterium]